MPICLSVQAEFTQTLYTYLLFLVQGQFDYG